jgi:hypothetical protein
MESPLSFFRIHWDHEPVRIPLNRPSGTYSPNVGEGWDERVQFMESLLSHSRVPRNNAPLRLTQARS